MENKKQNERHIFGKAIEKYIELLDAQMEAFPIIMQTLVAKQQACHKRMNKFMGINNIKKIEEDNNVILSIPVNVHKQFIKYSAELTQSISAMQLIPQNVVVAFVSIYDAYIADLIRCIYKLQPKLIYSCGREYSLSEILNFNSIEDVKEHTIEIEVESVLRENHSKQLEWLSKKLNIKLTEDLPILDSFIEITERRNLFVHTNGKVSRQYLSVINKAKKVQKNICIGDTLKASPEYVVHCYTTLFEIGVKLGQVIWRKLDEKNSLEEADSYLIDIIYDLLKNNKYNLAITLSEFATKNYVKDYDKCNEYTKCINKALAYYLKGDKEKCKSIISDKDWSASELKYKLAKVVLEEKYEEACAIMKKIGNNNDMYLAYSEWPLFNTFRNTKVFKEAYKTIYQEEYNYKETKDIKWEDIINESIELNNLLIDKKNK